LKTPKWLKLDHAVNRPYYCFAVLCGVDTPMLRVATHSWPWEFAPISVLFMMLVSARRFLDAGWGQWWAVPYSLFTLTPYLAFLSTSGREQRLAPLLAILLQLPAMIAWKRNRTAVIAMQ
jgi:hypothetical protein